MTEDSTRTDPLVHARMGGPVTALRYGRWTAELRGDEVAELRFDGVLLLRAVRPVVRDRDWNTVPARVVRTLAGADDQARLETELHFEADAISYAAVLGVTLAEDTLVVDFHGEARSSFLRNRIGLVVLHPATDAGQPVVVRHRDGSSARGRWPTAISPHQPFTGVAGFGWTKAGVTAELTLSGDVFETEDQRNWTDASFKTYSTPLSRPFPVAVAAGEPCVHQVRLQARGRAHAAGPGRPTGVSVGTAVTGEVPALALGAASYPSPAAPLTTLRGYDAVLVELTGSEETWPSLLAGAAEQAAELGAGLDVRVVTADPDVLRRTLALLRDHPLRRLGAFDPDSHLTSAALWVVLREEAARIGLTGTLVGGTRAHFAELNRGQDQLPADLPGLTFSLTPAMHADEVPHLLDSLAGQRAVVENARRIAAGRPLHLGPVTLARRFNAVATGARPDPATEARAATDPLQHSEFLAPWTLASVAALAVPGVASLCYFETSGARGVLRDDGSPTPAGVVLDQVAALRGRALLEVEVPDGVAALAVRTAAGVTVLVGDLSGADRSVPVHAPGQPTQTVELAPWSIRTILLGPEQTGAG